MSKELEDAFRSFRERDVDTFPVQVISVDKAAGTCIVKDDELEYTDVQLSAVKGVSNKKFLLIPKTGSTVLVSPINEDLKRLYVEAYSEIESCELVIGTTEFVVDHDGYLIKRGNETLGKLIDELLTAISNMTMAHPQGPTTAVINIAEFIALKTRFKTVLKSN
jgi:hypothetical protein